MPRPPRTAVRTAVVWEVLDTALAEVAGRIPDRAVGGPSARDAGVVAKGRLRVVDVGGGTGGFAVPLAEHGHHVTVVDPSPDALAALERRAAERGVAHLVRPLQGDARALAEIVGEQSADAVLAHGVLEYVDDPLAAVHALAAVLRPGGIASLLLAQRLGVVLARALAGRFADACRALDDPAGRWGDADPLPRRFDEADVVRLLEDTALRISEVHGVRLFTELLPGALVDDPDAAQALLDLERLAGSHPRYPQLAGLAAQLHVLARRD